MNPNDWIVNNLAGDGHRGWLDGSTAESRFSAPSSFCFSPSGHLYVADRSNNCIRKVHMNHKTVTTFAGRLQLGKDNGKEATFAQPSSIVYCPQGYFLVADRGNHMIRKVTAEGITSTFSGGLLEGYLDASREDSLWSYPCCLHSVPSGDVYVSDTGNDRIRLISSNGMVSTYAGCGGGFADGMRQNARFSQPWGLVVNAYNEVFVADWGNNCIRKIDGHGMVKTIAGGGRAGSKDGFDASFNCPIALLLTPQNDLLVADRNNHLIRYLRQDADTKRWETSTFAGKYTGNQDGNAAVASFTHPSALGWTPYGELLISSSDSIKILKEMTLLQKSSARDLATTFGVLLDQPGQALSDFQYKSFNTTTFWLHKAILIARAPKVLESGMEQFMSVLQVSDDSWNHFWRFIYDDRLPNILDIDKQWREKALSHVILHLDLVVISTLVGHPLFAQHCRLVIKNMSISLTLEDICSQLVRLSNDSVNWDTYSMVVTTFGQRLLQIKMEEGDSFSSNLEHYISGNPQITSSVMEALKTQALGHLPWEEVLASPSGLLFSQIKYLFPLIGSTLTSEIEDTSYEGYKLEPSISTTVKGPSKVSTEISMALAKEPLLAPDFTISVGEGLQIGSHKCILYSRWPYFRNMIDSGLAEALENQMEFPGTDQDGGFSHSAIKALVWFFYSNQATLFGVKDGLTFYKNAPLYGFIDVKDVAMPGFEELVRHCSNPLFVRPTPQTCVDLHKIACQFGGRLRQIVTRTTITANLPSIFQDTALKEQFDTLPLEERYSMLSDSFSMLVKTKKL